MSSFPSPARPASVSIALAIIAPFLASVGGCSSAGTPPLVAVSPSTSTAAAPTYLSAAPDPDRDLTLASTESSDPSSAPAPRGDSEIPTAQRAEPAAYADPLTLSTRAPAARDYRIGLDVAYLYGPVHGFTQTPSGGNPGTTSPHRPKFHEIGINDVQIVDASLTFGFGNHEIYAGGQFVGLSGDDTLDDTLISQGRTFPAGARVSSDVRLDWYRAGYRYRWVLDQGPTDRPVLTLYPSVGGALFTFDYKLNADAARASRSYTKGLPQLGLQLDWRPGGGAFTLSASILGFPPIDNIPAIITERLLARYEFLRRGGVSLEGFAGIAFEQFRYEDSQQVPNHIEADLGPLLIVGLSVGF